jgi:hypothetical protein
MQTIRGGNVFNAKAHHIHNGLNNHVEHVMSMQGRSIRCTCHISKTIDIISRKEIMHRRTKTT